MRTTGRLQRRSERPADSRKSDHRENQKGFLRLIFTVAIAAVFSAAIPARAEILFEGFYRIERAGQHVGYLVQRISVDKNEKTVVTYVRTEQTGGEVQQSTTSVSNAKNFAPILSRHIGNHGGEASEIDSQFTAKKLTVQFKTPKHRPPLKTEVTALERSAFLSSDLFYLLDFSKMQKQKNYSYRAFNEESGRMGTGVISLLDTKTEKGLKVIELLDDSNGQPVESFVTEGGYSLGSRALYGETVVYWVKSKAEAVGSFEFPTSELISLFKDLPIGNKTPWSKIPAFSAREAMASFAKLKNTRQIHPKDDLKSASPIPMRSL